MTERVQEARDWRVVLEAGISSMAANHELKSAVCDALEDIADSLPNQVNRQQCLCLARAIFPIIRRAQTVEEETFFPQLLALQPHDKQLAKAVQRLKFEHIEDESYARDIADVLFECGTYDRLENPEKIGFTLRGFFSTLRRHIAFEREYLLPIAHRFLLKVPGATSSQQPATIN